MLILVWLDIKFFIFWKVKNINVFVYLERYNIVYCFFMLSYRYMEEWYVFM